MFQKNLNNSISYIIYIVLLQIFCGDTVEINSYAKVSKNTGVSNNASATNISNDTAQSRQITRGNLSLIEK